MFYYQKKRYVCNFLLLFVCLLAAAFAEDFLENVNDIKDIINVLLKDYDDLAIEKVFTSL